MNFVFLIVFLAFISLIVDFLKKNKRKHKNDIPGPIRLPVIGNLHLLTSNPHRGLKKLSDKYGGIFSCYLGDHYSVVVSDITIINEIYVKKFEKFCTRPHSPTFKMFSNGYKDLVFSDNYDDWKSIRSLVGNSFTKTKLTQTIYKYIEEQSNLLIYSMKKYQEFNEPFYPDKNYTKVSMNVICKLFFSKEMLPHENENQGEMEKIAGPVRLITRQLGTGHLDDFVEISSPFFYFSKLKYKSYVDTIISHVKTIYQDHLKNLDIDSPKDLMDMLIINLKESNYHDIETRVIHTAFDFLLGGSDSVSGLMEWFTLYMINYPQCQEKAFNEIIKVMGTDCKMISFNDRTKLPYLNACVNECLRLRAEDPLGIPRAAVEDVEINGYFIPKGTPIHHNIYAVQLNEKVFNDPYTFNPERWLIDDQVKLKEQFNHLIPFSVGPRICIGKNLSELELFVVCSNLVLNFKMSSFYNPSKKINDIEDFGITIHPKPFAVKLEKRI